MKVHFLQNTKCSNLHILQNTWIALEIGALIIYSMQKYFMYSWNPQRNVELVVMIRVYLLRLIISPNIM